VSGAQNWPIVSRIAVGSATTNPNSNNSTNSLTAVMLVELVQGCYLVVQVAREVVWAVRTFMKQEMSLRFRLWVLGGGSAGFVIISLLVPTTIPLLLTTAMFYRLLPTFCIGPDHSDKVPQAISLPPGSTSADCGG